MTCDLDSCLRYLAYYNRSEFIQKQQHVAYQFERQVEPELMLPRLSRRPPKVGCLWRVLRIYFTASANTLAGGSSKLWNMSVGGEKPDNDGVPDTVRLPRSGG